VDVFPKRIGFYPGIWRCSIDEFDVVKAEFDFSLVFRHFKILTSVEYKDDESGKEDLFDFYLNIQINISVKTIF
jgi:hypothetical protein